MLGMDTKMEDAGKVPESHEGGAVVEAPSISTLDGWIENLMACKQLSETDVQRLCDKVSCFFTSIGMHRHRCCRRHEDKLTQRETGSRGFARRV